MDINMTLIGQSIAMLVFVWFCMKFIWPPIMQAIEERQTQIADGLAAAERGQQSLDKAQVESEDIIGDARKQATTILDQAYARASEIVSDGKVHRYHDNGDKKGTKNAWYVFFDGELPAGAF